MPRVRKARAALAQAQRHATRLEKQVLYATEGLLQTSGSAALKRHRAAFRNATVELRAARKMEAAAGKALADAISSDAAVATIRAQERAVAVYKEKLHKRRELALKKAQARFLAAWHKKRKKSDVRKLARKVKQEAAKAAQARKKANAKAKAAAELAIALAKARARKVAVRAKARAKKLAAKVKTKTQLAVKKAATKARLAALRAVVTRQKGFKKARSKAK
jgi:histone H1/5